MGGGIYAETGSEIVGTVIHSNQGGNGYGVGGGGITLLNCTVSMNKRIEYTRPVQFPGFVYCADGAVVDTVEYKSAGRTDAVGVVFWVNPDPYAVWPRGYVLALDGAEKMLSVGSGLPTFLLPMEDTNSYKKTRSMAQLGSEAALYCSDYMAGTAHEGKWSAPAGRYLSLLLNAYREVRKTLDCLSRLPDHEHVMQLQDGIYGSITEYGEKYFWTLSLNNSFQDLIQPVTGEFVAGDDNSVGSENIDLAYWFRPVLVY
jgi:hypothetical protein